MEIHIINYTNTKLLELFLSSNIPKQFRYFNNRTLDVIKNHKLTLLGTVMINNKEIPISYCHIDNKNNINWIGICVLEEYQNQGYGKQLFTYIMNYINTKNIENVKLTVDIDNWKALNMYLKNGFNIINITSKYYELKLIKSPLLEVSLGEAIDKLTILDIKKKKIKDDRTIFVEKEYNILFKELENYIINNKYYYNILLDINKKIWEMQDDFRYSHNNTKNELCLKIIDENDRRFRVKKKINNLYNSELKEQKGYKPKKAFVLTHLGLGDNITSIGAVRYLSTQYDEVYVVCKNKYKQNVEMFYSDDKDIKIVSVESDKYISPNFGFNKEKFNGLIKNMDLYLCGCHLLNKKKHPTSIIPFNFYYDLNLNPEIFWKYFHINNCDESKKLYNIIKDYKIVFIHNKASTGIAFNENTIIKKLGIEFKENTIIINPDKNMYDKTHKFYNIAEQFILQPLLYYIDTIINSKYVILTDSCFFCLSINLPIKTKNCYYISRNKHNYEYLYDKKFGYNTYCENKIFSQLII